MRKMLGFVFVLLCVLALSFSSVQAKPIAADIIFVVDESGSMAGEHAWIQDMVIDLENALVNAGVGVTKPNRYALVGFGGHVPGDVAHKHTVGSGDWGSASDLATAASGLVTSGGAEDGYQGMNFALTQYSFRSDAAVNVILITDEDRTTLDSTLDYNSIYNLFKSKNALLNVVVDHSFYNSNGTTQAIGISSNASYIADGSGGYVKDSNGYTLGYGYGNTYDDYVKLALALGGAAWDLNVLRSGGYNADSFTAAFVDVKVQEIQQQQPQPIPEPSTALLVCSGLLLVGIFAKKRRSEG